MLERHLQALFGFTSFRQGQKEIIEALIGGADVLAMLPTGRGKSLCYQLPAFLANGVTIVVSPLLALMEDQVQQLKSIGLKQTAALNSFTEIAERRRLLRNLAKVKLLYTSPEMLQSRELLAALAKVNVAYIVVDEAHCVSYWGHDFRADYLRICDIKQALGSPPCLAITATATKEVRADIKKRLDLRTPFEHIESVNRSNIVLLAEEAADQAQKQQRLVEMVATYQAPGIIYVQSRAQAEACSTYLAQEVKNVRTSFYHGGMENANRLLVQQQFMNGQLDVICATNAFGMGLNKTDVRYVIHLHYPLDIASYIQEIGRAGRDGALSFALLLTAREDRVQAENLLKKNDFTADEWVWALSQLKVGEPLDFPSFENRLLAMQSDQARTVVYLLEKWGVIKAGLVQSFSVAKLTSLLHRHFKEQIAAKKNRLLPVFHYGRNDQTCRRQQLLSYFDEIPAFQNPCCDVCGLTLDSFKQQPVNVNEEPFLWEEELKAVFAVAEEKR